MVSVRFLLPLAVFPFGVVLHAILNGFPSFGVSLFAWIFCPLSGFCSCVESSACVYSVFRVGAVFIFVQCLHGCSEMQVNVHEVSFARDLLIFRSSFVSRVLFLASSWFYAAGVFAGIRCGSPRGCICSGYPLASICCGGVFAGIRCRHPCVYTLPAYSCMLGCSGSSAASPASCGLCTVSSRCRCLTGSRPGVSTCSEVVLSSSARSLLVCVVGFLLARAVFF